MRTGTTYVMGAIIVPPCPTGVQGSKPHLWADYRVIALKKANTKLCTFPQGSSFLVKGRYDQ